MYSPVYKIDSPMKVLGKDDENEICLVGMKSAGNELVSTIGSSVELGIASQIQMPLNHHFYGVCSAPGIMFQDITTLLLNHKAFKDTVDIFVDRYRDDRSGLIHLESTKKQCTSEYDKAMAMQSGFHTVRFAWLRNNEFSRQALAGVNPVNIQLLREFPILSKLDPAVYGPPESAITKDLIEQEKWLEKCICHVS
ncbi:hypothetical protein LOK49_Contig125G00013 [Camellia lanceoleosa]|nr:hypothetical protein LOK49_Contig125G00013 [Camellia lanceoleosa]